MRLIDAQEYAKELKSEMDYPGRHPEFISAIECAIADLSDMPTIEVGMVENEILFKRDSFKSIAVDATEPIVNAFWKKRVGHGAYWYACSNCDTDVPKDRWGNDYFSRRCPHCGAHMDFESVETEATDE